MGKRLVPLVLSAFIGLPIHAYERLIVDAPPYTSKNHVQKSNHFAGWLGVVVLATGLPVSLAGSALEDDRVTAIGLSMILGGLVTVTVSHYICPTPEKCADVFMREVWDSMARQAKVYIDFPQLAGEESEFYAVARALHLDVPKFASLIISVSALRENQSDSWSEQLKREYFANGFKDDYQKTIFGNLVSMAGYR